MFLINIFLLVCGFFIPPAADRVGNAINRMDYAARRVEPDMEVLHVE
jgi:hypothetical protein